MGSEHQGQLWNRSFILLAFGNLMMAIGFYFLIPTLPIYVVEELHAKPSEVGYILAIYTVSALIIRPFTGIALDTWGRKWIFLISLLVFTLTIAVYPLMSSFLFLLALRFFHGFSWGVATTSSITVVVDVIPPHKRGRGIGYFGISFTVSMAIAPVLALVILEATGYLTMFMTAALFSFCGLVLATFVRYPVFIGKREKVRYTWKQFIEPRGVPISIPLALFGAAYGGVFSFITLFDKDLGLELAGTFFIILAGGVTISRLFAGQILDRYGPTYIMMAGFIISIIGFFILGWFTSSAGFLISAILIGIGAGILIPTLLALGNNIVGFNRRGAINATLITAFDLGIGTGSLGLGFLSELIGFPGMYLISTLILFVALTYYFVHTNGFYLKRYEKEGQGMRDKGRKS